jgi:hypothetical protein
MMLSSDYTRDGSNHFSTELSFHILSSCWSRKARIRKPIKSCFLEVAHFHYFCSCCGHAKLVLRVALYRF